MNISTKAEQREKEFNENVWDHSNDEFQLDFAERRELSNHELALLRLVVEGLEFDDSRLLKAIRDFLLSIDDPQLVEILIQIAGLTNSKILQDYRAQPNTGKVGIQKVASALRKEYLWLGVGRIMLTHLRKVLKPIAKKLTVETVLESLNQATWAGFVRQRRAKLSGHEAERRMAEALESCGIPFEPTEKLTNPRCPDIQIANVSFDLVIPAKSNTVVCVKSTVHTANIGMYGQSKDKLEMEEAKACLGTLGVHPPTLIAFIDGVGFHSNRKGLIGVLDASDEFCQFSTMWKLVVVCAHRLGKSCLLDIPNPAQHSEFISRFKKSVTIKNLSRNKRASQVGNGRILVL